METAIQSKSERINLRVQSNAKRLIVRAAGFEGKTISHFILNSALKCAEETIQEYQMMTLNAKDSMAFFDALATPVQFNRKLTAALKEHDKRIITK